ncbi:MAG: excinuclease ABC subunit UvrC [Magnetococcales bacterium]|nr:excinuclease ABC subunit UvrC [Magnetococcales bacterium]
MKQAPPHPLQERLPTLPLEPGVYRFLDEAGRVLYVGKAKALRKRVASYFTGSSQPSRVRVMLGHARELEITVTASENDALILEANLIKRFRPRYNVLLKDDKSYPYLHLSTDHPFPRLSLYRGDRKQGGRYYGPYPSVVAVRETLRFMQSIFPIRQCRDSQFSQRTRPCLQYQIKRCRAPCSDRVGKEEYGRWIQEVMLFLEGKDRVLVDLLNEAMWEAAEKQAYEEAARIREQIKSLAHVQEQRKVNLPGDPDLDVVGLFRDRGQYAVQVLMVRQGNTLGSRSFFPENTGDLEEGAVLEAFLEQYYGAGQAQIPPEILLDRQVMDPQWLEAALSRRREGVVHLRQPVRGARRRLVEMAVVNARQALTSRLSGSAAHRRQLADLATALGLEEPLERIEAYDISHISDSHPVGSLVVFTSEGFQKKSYRKFILSDPALLDDTARMAALLSRRFRRLVNPPDGPRGGAQREKQSEESGRKDSTGGLPSPGKADQATIGRDDPSSDQSDIPQEKQLVKSETHDMPKAISGSGPDSSGEISEEKWPDLVLLDGGLGQLNAVLAVAMEEGFGHVPFCAVAKGPDRNAGRERLFLPGGEPPSILSPDSPTLFLIQNIRDEAHRFAIGFHRSRREKSQTRSVLDEIAGIGPKRKRMLLSHFGSVKAIKGASLPELTEMSGLPKELAQRIFDHFNEST